MNCDILALLLNRCWLLFAVPCDILRDTLLDWPLVPKNEQVDELSKNKSYYIWLCRNILCFVEELEDIQTSADTAEIDTKVNVYMNLFRKVAIS